MGLYFALVCVGVGAAVGAIKLKGAMLLTHLFSRLSTLSNLTADEPGGKLTIADTRLFFHEIIKLI